MNTMPPATPVEPSDERRRRAPGLAVAPQHAEAARRALKEASLLAPHLNPVHGPKRIIFPLQRTPDDATLKAITTAAPEAELTETIFTHRASRETDYRDRLKHLSQALRERLPRAHDVIGDIAVLKLPEELQPHRKEIADALMSVHPRLATVALDHGVEGEQRVRNLEVIAGEPRLETTHREHGLTLHVEPHKAYFSPRLATERHRLLARIHPGQRVLDLFAGIGAFVCLVAREHPEVTITAIDVNPHAVRLLKKNLQANRIEADRIHVIEGDTREEAPRTGDWDHVVMNLPHDAHRFLDVAADCASPQGEIHLYAILEREDESSYIENALATLQEHTGNPWRLAERRHVRQYAPTMDGLAFSFTSTRRIL